jgi:uncharacterized membrane protein YhaH (DUF805 family)
VENKMSKNKKYITIIGLIIAILFSFLIFFGIGNAEKTQMQISSFIFVLLTEIIIFANIIILTSKKLNTFAIAGISSSTIIYAIISLIVNILFVGVFKTIRTNLVFNFGLLLIYVFVVVMVMLFKKEEK